MVYFSRSKRCLFSGPHCASPQTFPPFCLPGPSFSVHSTSLWTLLLMGVHQVHGNSPFTPAVTGYKYSLISGRLADSYTIPAPGDPGHSSPSFSSGPIGSQGEPGEKLSTTFPEHYFWCNTRYHYYEDNALQSVSLPLGQVDSCST